MERIKIKNISRYESYMEVIAEYTLNVPDHLSSEDNAVYIVQSYFPEYTVINIDNVDYLRTTVVSSFLHQTSAIAIKEDLVSRCQGLQNELNSIETQDYDSLIQKTYDGIDWL